jgi:hypothetical protein
LQEWVWFGATEMQTESQRFNIGLWQGRRGAAGAAYNRQDAGHLKHAHALGPLDTDKDITGEQREIQGNPRSVAPLALCLIEGQIVLDVPHAQVLIDTLFMACRGVDGKPMQCEMGTNHRLCGGAVRLRDIELCGLRQRF